MEKNDFYFDSRLLLLIELIYKMKPWEITILVLGLVAALLIILFFVLRHYSRKKRLENPTLNV
jgi:hypothetical protein